MKKTQKLPNGLFIDHYQLAHAHPKKYILYLHGGGLVYGTKSDIPSELTQLFLQNEYEVIAFDYLLAPNTPLKEILQTLEESVAHVKKEIVGDSSYGFCGRSAGSFLMLQLVKQAPEIQPDFLVNFYGYTDLSFLSTERLLTTQEIPESAIQAIDTRTAVGDDPFLERYLLYHYAVQKNLLYAFLGLTQQTAEQYTLLPSELASFPPCFSTASTTDKEIPFRYSKQLAKQIPASQFIPLYYLEHDFLKHPEQKPVQELLSKLETWLKVREHTLT